jgi:hypothetical protein
MNDGKFIFKNKRKVFDSQKEANDYAINKINEGFMCYFYKKDSLNKFIVETFVTTISKIEVE